MKRTLASLLCFLLFGQASFAAAAQKTKRTPRVSSLQIADKEPIVAAQQLFSEGLYADAVPILDDLLAGAGLDEARRAEALFLLGSCHLALGHEPAARARFLTLLADNVDFPLPAYTPRKIQALFEQLRSEQKHRPTIAVGTPDLVAGALGDTVRVRFTVQNLHDRDAVALWRRQSEPVFRAVPLMGASELVATITLPASTELRTRLEYYAEVREGDRVLARAGSASEPLRFEHTAIAVETPVYKKAWFWGVLSAAALTVAGGAVAVYMGTRPSAAPPPSTGSIAVTFGGAR
jgi:hypothetical protein